MYSLEAIVKLNSPEVSAQIHKNASALNLGAASVDCPKSTEKTGIAHDRRDSIAILWELLD